ncbi:hypothetical protein SLEP1_g12430 [Rubroshorea leprosula]|uniref:Uncharacterized protein n=1 Tax=Rubroshorea leprosula TaxID=152421 RepID=A0AAV5ILY4_9ROSI|nr:hypothetical protein SLEP1_g12430 [Rubroshorea leprosula]
MEQETVTFKLPMIQADILSCILFGLGRMFRGMPAVKLGMVVRPDTISLGVFVGKRRMAFLSLRGFGVGISRPIILTRMMDFDDLDFAVHSFSMAVNEGRFPRSLDLCASRVLSEGCG